MTEKLTYIGIIGQRYPGVQVSAPGDGSDYESLVLNEGSLPLPTQAQLDADILDQLKIDTWREIQAERDRRKSGGVLIDTKWYHSDDTSRIQFLGMMLYGASLPPGIMWKTMDGTFIEMTPTLVQQAFATIAGHDTACFTVAEQRKAAVFAMTDSTTIVAYDHLTGTPTWPTIYGE